jgi:hypothetical protein
VLGAVEQFECLLGQCDQGGDLGSGAATAAFGDERRLGQQVCSSSEPRCLGGFDAARHRSLDVVAVQPAASGTQQTAIPDRTVGEWAAQRDRPVVEAARLLPRQHPLSGLGGSLVPVGRDLLLTQHGRLVPVPGQIGQLIVTRPLVRRERLGDAPVHQRQGRPVDPGFDGVADQDVHEPEPSGQGRRLHQSGRERLVQLREHLQRRAFQGRRHNACREVAGGRPGCGRPRPGHGRFRRHPSRLLFEGGFADGGDRDVLRMYRELTSPALLVRCTRSGAPSVLDLELDALAATNARIDVVRLPVTHLAPAWDALDDVVAVIRPFLAQPLDPRPRPLRRS